VLLIFLTNSGRRFFLFPVCFFQISLHTIFFKISKNWRGTLKNSRTEINPQQPKISL
jgi:hypothetical protein